MTPKEIIVMAGILIEIAIIISMVIVNTSEECDACPKCTCDDLEICNDGVCLWYECVDCTDQGCWYYDKKN